MDLAASRQQAGTPIERPAVGAPETAGTMAVPAATGPAFAQLGAVVKKLSQAVSASDFDAFLGRDGEVFDVARLYLAAAAAMSKIRAIDLLGVHEINLLYRYKERLEPVSSERVLLLRTVIASRAASFPGWYWARATSANIAQLLAFFAASDASAEVRTGALKLLGTGKIAFTFDRERRAQWGRGLLNDQTKEVREEAFNYVMAVGGDEYVAVLDELVAGGELTLAKRALQVKASLLIDDNPNEAFRLVLEGSGSTFENVPDRVVSRLAEIESGLLKAALQSTSNHIRSLALAELIRRREMSQEDAQPYLKDLPGLLRGFAYRELLHTGAAIDPKKVRKALTDFGGTVLGGLSFRSAPDPEEIIAATTADCRLRNCWKSLIGTRWTGP